VADAVVIIPTVSADTVTPHPEAFQAVVWHLVVSRPTLKRNEMKWESVVRAAVERSSWTALNRNVFNPLTGTYDSPHRAEDFELLPGVLKGLALLQETGYRLILVSNQPSYAKGKISLAAIQAIHRRLADTLGGAGISFDAFYYCLHHPDGVIPEFSGRCECRKPSPYFLLQAKARF
jgi:D-glycero-D-manno-heptose 1,7-bisphosphate phosphatase